MKENTIRKRNYLFEFLGIIEVLAIYLIWFAAVRSAELALYGMVITYYPLAWTLRLTLQRHHRAGMRHLKAQKFSEALECFRRSEGFFRKYPWIDRYRFITMFASSAYSYLEMALQNQAYALVHLDRPAEAIEPLEKLLAIAPDRADVSELLSQLCAAVQK